MPAEFASPLDVEWSGQPGTRAQSDNGVVARQPLVTESTPFEHRADHRLRPKLANQAEVATDGCHRQMPGAGSVAAVEAGLRVHTAIGG
jgi:hypothetical protein